MPSRSRRWALAGVLAPAVLAAASAPAAATPPACAIATTELADRLRALPGHPRVKRGTERDADSGEPVLRDAIAYAEGARFLLVQHNCAIYNLQLSMLASGPDPSETDLDRFAAILAATPLWRAKFAGIDPGTMIRAELASEPYRSGRAAGKPFSYATDALPVTGETSETLVAFNPAKRELRLTIAAGI